MLRGKRIKIPIFPAWLVVYYGDEPLTPKYKDTKKPIFDNFTHDKFARGCVVCNDTKLGYIECLIFINSLNPDWVQDSVIVHECEHAKDAVIEGIGLDSGDSELNAYLLDWIFTQVSNFVYNRKPTKGPRWKKQQA